MDGFEKNIDIRDILFIHLAKWFYPKTWFKNRALWERMFYCISQREKEKNWENVSS